MLPDIVETLSIAKDQADTSTEGRGNVTLNKFQRSYADFGISRSLRQVRHAVSNRKHSVEHMEQLFQSMELPVKRIESRLDGRVEDKQILEIGPGQGMERALYFATKNTVTALDRDIIPSGFDPLLYLQMARENGPGRVVKTLGRDLLIGRSNRAAWRRLVGPVDPPQVMSGDIETDPLDLDAYDVVLSWSVFEHLADPRAALDNVVRTLRPGGVAHISIHVFTAHDGHHDIRAFTGQGDSLPLWGHLRPQTKSAINPSSFLNEWRIDQWRELFAEVMPGADEYLDEYETRERFGPRLTPELRGELADYSEAELFTVNQVFVWRKPGG